MNDAVGQALREVAERGWSVVNADCRAVLPLLADASVDFVLTDPPYGHNNNDGDLISRWEEAMGDKVAAAKAEARPIANDGEEATPMLVEVLGHVRRLLRHGGCCCCCGGGGGPDPQFARWSLLMDGPLEFKHMVVWDKGPIGMGWHYRRSYETVLVAQKRGGPCKWYDESDKVENVIRPGHAGPLGPVRKIIPAAGDHPTPKPFQLAACFVAYHTAPGDLVLDPFCGAGWVGVACKLMGRRFLGVEIDPHWASMAVRRIGAAGREQTYQHDVAGEAPLFAGGAA